MSRFRMNGPNFGQSRPKTPRPRHRVLGWVFIVAGVPCMGFLPLAMLPMVIDGTGYLAGAGENVTVTVVKSSVGDPTPLPRGDPGEGYYTCDGERGPVSL